ncbi:hypothetical protein [Streptomyces luteireticuli]|uniref:hypothetical protein n=1 Tax=Streptomyces luteireticuli TaxID=173858 RepID=UPI003557E648
MKTISASIPVHRVGEIQKISHVVEIQISEPFAAHPDLTPQEREAILQSAVAAVRAALPRDLESILPTLRVAEDRTL